MPERSTHKKDPHPKVQVFPMEQRSIRVGWGEETDTARYSFPYNDKLNLSVTCRRGDKAVILRGVCG